MCPLSEFLCDFCEIPCIREHINALKCTSVCLENSKLLNVLNEWCGLCRGCNFLPLPATVIEV